MRHIPNILTIMNLMCGLAAIIFLIRGGDGHTEFVVAALVVIGGVIDFFDGFAARRLNAASEFGKQLDSFADLVTFGVAPVCLVHAVYDLSVPIIISTVLFVVAGIYRLARYNIGNYKRHFLGLPITAAGITLAAYCAARPLWQNANLISELTDIIITTILIITLSVMMASNVKVKRV